MMKLIVRVSIYHILTYIHEKNIHLKNEFLRFVFCNYIEDKWTIHPVLNIYDKHPYMLQIIKQITSLILIKSGSHQIKKNHSTWRHQAWLPFSWLHKYISCIKAIIYFKQKIPRHFSFVSSMREIVKKEATMSMKSINAKK